MNTFSEWLLKLEGNVAASGPVFPGRVDVALQSIRALLQEHSEKQPVFQNIYDKVKRMSNAAAPQEADRLNEMYTQIAAKNQVLTSI